MQKIHQEVEEIARRVFAIPGLRLTDQTSARDVEKWDSLTHIQFIVEVEKRFGAKFRNAEIARLQSIGDLKKLVAKYRPEMAA
jgi:acyl carrier protein